MLNWINGYERDDWINGLMDEPREGIGGLLD